MFTRSKVRDFWPMEMISEPLCVSDSRCNISLLVTCFSPDEVVYIGTTSLQSSEKLYNKADDVVYIGTTTSQTSPKQPDDIIYVGTSTSQSAQKRKAYDKVPLNTWTKKSRFDDNSPQRTATTTRDPSETKQRKDDMVLDQSSNYKKRKKPDDYDESIKKPLIPPPPLPPQPPSYCDSLLSHLTNPPPVPTKNYNSEVSQSKRFKSSSTTEYSRKFNKTQDPLGNYENGDPRPSQNECKTKAESSSQQKDFKNLSDKLRNLGKFSETGSYKKSRFTKDTESYQHLACSRNDLPEKVSSDNSGGMRAQLENSRRRDSNYKVPKKSRFSDIIDRSSQNSENRSLQNKLGGGTVDRNDSSYNVAVSKLNARILNQHESQKHDSTSALKYNESVTKSSDSSCNSSFTPNINSKFSGNSTQGYSNGTSSNTSMFADDKVVTLIQQENSENSSKKIDLSHITKQFENIIQPESFGSGTNTSLNEIPLPHITKQFENIRQTENVGSRTNTGNSANSSNQIDLSHITKQFENIRRPESVGSGTNIGNAGSGINTSLNQITFPYLTKQFENIRQPEKVESSVISANSSNQITLPHITKQFETIIQPEKVGSRTKTGNSANSSNQIANITRPEKSPTNLTQFKENTGFPKFHAGFKSDCTNFTQFKENTGFTTCGFKNYSKTNSCSQLGKPVSSKNPSHFAENKEGFAEFQNKKGSVVSVFQGNAREFKTLNSSSDDTFPTNVLPVPENTSIKASNPISQTSTYYNFSADNVHQLKYEYSKTFSKFNGNTRFEKSHIENTKQVDCQSTPGGALGNTQEQQIDSVHNFSEVKSFPNEPKQMEYKEYPGNYRFQENTGNCNSIKNNYDSNEKYEILKFPLKDGEMQFLEYKEDILRKAMLYPPPSIMPFDKSCSGANASILGFEHKNSNQMRCRFENNTCGINENFNINRDPSNIQFGMKKRTTTGMTKTNYQHNKEIDQLFGNKISPHHRKVGRHVETVTTFVSQLAQNRQFYNINPAPPVPDLTKPPPPLPHLGNSADNRYMNLNNWQNRQHNAEQRFGHKKHFKENNVVPTRGGYGRNMSGQTRNNNNSVTRTTRAYGENAYNPKPTRQFAAYNGLGGVRKGPGNFVNKNSNRANTNRFKPNSGRNSIHNTNKNNRMKQPWMETTRHNKRETPNKFAKLLKLVKTKYNKKPKDPTRKEKRKKLKKSNKSTNRPNSDHAEEHIDVNKQVFGDFAPLKVGLKKPAKGHLKPKPEIYWKEWWSLYGYVENCLTPIDPEDVDIKSAINFLPVPKDAEFRKRKRTLLVEGVAKILRHIKLNESDYALRDVFSLLKYKHQLEDPNFQKILNAKENERVERVLKHARKKTRRALFYQNMICRWHFSTLVLKRANAGEAFLKCGHARKLLNDKAFNYLVWESIQELKKLIAEDWPEFEQFYKSL